LAHIYCLGRKQLADNLPVVTGKTFRPKATALALSGLMVFSAAAPFNAEAQGPAAPPSVASQPANTNTAPATAQQKAEQVVGEAINYSFKGVSIVVVLNKNETLAQYKSDLASVMRFAQDNGVPAQIFLLKSDKPSYAYFMRNATEFRLPPTHKDNYQITELFKLGGDAVGIYRQSLRAEAAQAPLKEPLKNAR
jgi:hypothetical protein